MELNFKNKGGAYEAQVKVEGDFNIHVERPKTSLLKIYQKSSEEGQYASESSWGSSKEPKVIDEDFSMLVYPKVVKIVSGAPVEKASVDCKEGVAVVTSRRAVQASDFTKIQIDSQHGSVREVQFSSTYAIESGEQLTLFTDKTLIFCNVGVRVSFQHDEQGGYYSFFNDPGGVIETRTVNMSEIFVEE